MSVWAAVEDHFPGDEAVGRWLQANDPGGEPVIEFVRNVGSTPAAIVTMALFVAVLLTLDLSGRVPGMRRAALVVSLMALGFVLQGFLKEVVDRPRTSVEFLDPRAGFGSASYPSGHSMSSVLASAIGLWLALRLAWPRALWGWSLRGALALWSLGVGLLSPWVAVTAGVHWPSDALGGIVWALIVLIPGFVILGRWRAEGLRSPRSP
jgi:membrane-associated phospholipid phosphatase